MMETIEIIIIDIAEYTAHKKQVPETPGHHYKIRVNDQFLVFEHPKVTREEILLRSGHKHPDCYCLYQKFKDCDFEKVRPKEEVNLAKPGIEHFVTKDTDVFHYEVDDDPELTEATSMTPEVILKEAGIDPKTHYLVEINTDGTQISYKNKPEVQIQIRCHPRRKFISVLNGPTPVS